MPPCSCLHLASRLPSVQLTPTDTSASSDENLGIQSQTFYVKLLGAFLLVVGVVWAIHMMAMRMDRKHWRLEAVITEGIPQSNDTGLVRGRENRKRERRCRYDTPGYRERPEDAAVERQE